MGVVTVLAGCRPDDAGTDGPDPTVRTPVDHVPEIRHQRQPGITTLPAAFGLFAAFDLSGHGRTGLASVLEALTDRITSLSGKTTLSHTMPDPTITVGLGSSLFDERFRLQHQRPRHLRAMPSFPNDALEPKYCHGDLSIQVDASSEKITRQALQELYQAATGRLHPRWQMAGFRPENHVTGQVVSTRNLFGFREGAGNPDPRDKALMNELVWLQPGSDEPAWTVGGTYQVVRLIRFATELWNAEPVDHQEDVFGRHKRTGAPLAGNREDQVPNFAVDPNGQITPLDAHIRRANPRTPQTEANRILRRSYSYRRGRDAAGRPDEGLIFICFQQDLERGFATVQQRLRGEALEKYVLPFGGGYFFVLPAAPRGGYLGQQLLEAAD
jgi:deferrochelatase/peroxidase EfeB